MQESVTDDEFPLVAEQDRPSTMHHALTVGFVEPSLVGSDQRFVGDWVVQSKTAPVILSGPLDRCTSAWLRANDAAVTRAVCGARSSESGCGEIRSTIGWLNAASDASSVASHCTNVAISLSGSLKIGSKVESHGPPISI